jgi:NTE family protein
MAEGKTALVLSAGGMFGAYQAGAYRAIAAQVQPDMVVGVSVGALNGWAIASGCTPEHLIERWLEPTIGSALDAARLQAQAERMARDYQPRVPFVLAVTRLPWFRTEMVTCPDVTAAHLQASCSIPMFLPSVLIGGSRFVDGGLFERLPIGAAIDMGATRVIAVDCLGNIDSWWLRAGMRVAGMLKRRRAFPAGVEVTIISPSEPLGTAHDAVVWKREKIERWIALGERDAATRISEAYRGSETAPHR